MKDTDLPFDLTGCTVSRVNWPDRGFELVLGGETAGGRAVEGARLVFENVANVNALEQFLRTRRRIERVPGFMSRNTLAPFPLKLPSTLTHLKLSRAARVSYGDVAFTDAFGKPPVARANQKLFLFALAEKRFKNRKPFPIICGGLSLNDGNGGVLSGIESPTPRRWPREEYQRLGTRFFEAIAGGDLDAARNLLARSCRKRIKPAQIARLIGDFLGAAERFATSQPGSVKGKKTGAIERFRPHMFVNVEDDARTVWEIVQGSPVGFPREAVRAVLELCSDWSRESLYVYVVEEDGEPRLEL